MFISWYKNSKFEKGVMMSITINFVVFKMQSLPFIDSAFVLI